MPSLTLVASTGANPNLDGLAAYAERQAYEEGLLESARPDLASAPPAIEQLVLAADQFIVRRSLPGEPEGRSVIAGYPWFGDWGRDTMISLPGLTLATGRHEVAAGYWPPLPTMPVRVCCLTASQMRAKRPSITPSMPRSGTLRPSVPITRRRGTSAAERSVPGAGGDHRWHRRGTRYRIRLDAGDGLLYAGEEGVQLTWMDAKVDDWVVTPRIGKPVEINALWYNALRTMAEFARRLGKMPGLYDEMADRAAESFGRFWNPDLGYCYDVIDGPDGDDPALRPNQLFAVSLVHSPLAAAQQRAVVDACARHLLTSHGLRSLAPNDEAYIGHYGGDRRQRDAAYHQGTVWGWLIGPFVSAHLRTYGDPEQARSFLRPLFHHLADHGVGSLSEIFDGDAPFAPRGCFAQAWTVAEVLRVWRETARMGTV